MKILKWIGILLVIIILGAVIFMKSSSQDYPQGVQGPVAEALAQEMLTAIKHDRLDSTGWVGWTFPGGHSYIWDVQRDLARVSYGDTEVLLDLDTQQGTAKADGISLQGAALTSALQKAWSLWCNDSWWLIAPHKIMDAGTSRSVVDVSDRHPGHRGLLVQYAGGGVTPNDAYLWIIDADGMPIGYEMWVEIIPVKGMYSSWEGYQALHSGALVSTVHDLAVSKMGLGPLRNGPSYIDLGLEEDIFAELY